MIKHGIRALLLASAVGIPAALAQAPAPAPAPKPLEPAASDPIVATVDGAPIRRSDVAEVQRTLPPQFQQIPLEMLYPAVIERLIDSKLIANAAKKENLQNDPQVKQRVASLEERVMQEAYLTRRLENVVTEDALRTRYEKFVKENPPKEEIRARHILVSSEAQANEVIAQLKKGADFAALAKEKSTDPSGKQNGGDLGYFSREEMVPEFSEAAFKLKPGETTSTPVKSQFGWHVIKLEDRRQTTPALAEMREQLAGEIQEEAVNDILGGLRKDAKVERFGLDGSSGSSQPGR